VNSETGVIKFTPIPIAAGVHASWSPRGPPTATNCAIVMSPSRQVGVD
jgi:hypothetical protein